MSASPMHKVFAVFIILLFLNPRSFAWGPEGHRIVAILAQERLTANAKHEIKALLGDESLTSIATFADDIRKIRPGTKRWHFVDIPFGQSIYDAKRDCQETENGDCIVAELERAKEDLRNTAFPIAKRAEALKFIVHFIGDIHEPMNCVDNLDSGGNYVPITWFGKKSNLHEIWDNEIIMKTNLPEKEYAEGLDRWLDSQDEREIRSGTIIDWANQCHLVAEQAAYPGTEHGGSLDVSYFVANRFVVDQQLATAGVRLAEMLNNIFRPQGTDHYHKSLEHFR